MGSAPTALEISGGQEASFDLRYRKSVPGDEVLAKRFEEYFEAHKSDFAPLSVGDRRIERRP